MKQVTVAIFLCVLYFQPATAQWNAALQPVYFVDSVRVSEIDIDKYDPNDILNISVYKGSAAIKILGADGKNGVVYIETKKLISSHYWQFFRNKSAEYFKAVPDRQADSMVVYIVNEKLLAAPVAGELSLINESNFISLKIIDQGTLIENYGIKNKKYGVVVQYGKPSLKL